MGIYHYQHKQTGADWVAEMPDDLLQRIGYSVRRTIGGRLALKVVSCQPCKGSGTFTSSVRGVKPRTCPICSGMGSSLLVGAYPV